MGPADVHPESVLTLRTKQQNTGSTQHSKALHLSEIILVFIGKFKQPWKLRKNKPTYVVIFYQSLLMKIRRWGK